MLEEQENLLEGWIDLAVLKGSLKLLPQIVRTTDLQAKNEADLE